MPCTFPSQLRAAHNSSLGVSILTARIQVDVSILHHIHTSLLVVEELSVSPKDLVRMADSFVSSNENTAYSNIFAASSASLAVCMSYQETRGALM